PDRAVVEHADVVDGDVEPAEGVDDVGHHAIDLSVVATVGDRRDGLAAVVGDLGNHRFGVGGAHVVDRHAGTGTSEPARDLAADPGAGPGDQHCRARVIDGDAHWVASASVLKAPAPP